MDADPTTVASVGVIIVEAVKELLKRFDLWREAKDKITREEMIAIRCLQKAVISTSQYVGAQESGATEDNKRERELSNLWSDAGLAFVGLNQRISIMLLLKAHAWAQKDKWIEEKVASTGITLDHMNEELLRILRRHDPSA